MKTKNNTISLIRDSYFLFIPILITILIYTISLTYGFRNFDEDTLIKEFCVKKHFSEYLEKFLLIYSGGVTQANGFAFSSIRNVHFSLLGTPSHYLLCYLLKGIPFLFHIWGLFFHLLALYFFTKLCYIITKNKSLALFSGIMWSLHPTNVEAIIWATNWACPVGASIYFFTLYKVVSMLKEKSSSNLLISFVALSTVIQIFLVEHTIMLPIAIFLLALHETKIFKSAIKVSLPSFLVIIAYFILRTVVTNSSVNDSAEHNLADIFERIVYLSPQVFVHNLKLLLFPAKLTIDQLDLLNLDKTFLGAYNVFCIIIFILFIFGTFALRNTLPDLSNGCIVYFFSILPFLQIIPLYSVVAERYNYFGSAFFVYGIISTLFKFLEGKNKIRIALITLLALAAYTKSFLRITEWKDSSTLFQSTINDSKSLLKKGIWTYNLAISEEDANKKDELLKLSINLLNLYLKTDVEKNNVPVLDSYELDSNSLHAKAALRIAQIYEIFGEKELQYNYLTKALDISRNKSQIRGLIYKNLGTYYFQIDDFNKSISSYEKSYSISQEPSTLYAIAVSYLKLKDYTTYEKYLKQSVSVISQNNAAGFKTYGQLLEFKGDYINALKYYKIATLLEDKPEPYVLLATLYIKLNEFDKSLKTINDGLYGFSNNPSLLYLRGSIYLNKNKTELGIQDLIKATNSEKAQSDIKIAASQILVDIFLQKKDFENAVKYNDLILTIEPNNAEALKNKNTLMLR